MSFSGPSVLAIGCQMLSIGVDDDDDIVIVVIDGELLVVTGTLW